MYMNVCMRSCTKTQVCVCVCLSTCVFVNETVCCVYMRQDAYYGHVYIFSCVILQWQILDFWRWHFKNKVSKCVLDRINLVIWICSAFSVSLSFCRYGFFIFIAFFCVIKCNYFVFHFTTLVAHDDIVFLFVCFLLFDTFLTIPLYCPECVMVVLFLSQLCAIQNILCINSCGPLWFLEAESVKLEYVIDHQMNPHIRPQTSDLFH